MLDKTLNGDGYTPVKADGAFARQLAIASALRSSAARRSNTLRLASSSPASPPDGTTSQKHSPGVTLPPAVRDGDSLPRKSEPKNQVEAHSTAEPEPPKEKPCSPQD
jgi:hypothetical protein